MFSIMHPPLPETRHNYVKGNQLKIMNHGLDIFAGIADKAVGLA
jgi:hypothetical protein